MRWTVAILAGLLLVPGFAGAWVHVHVGDGASRIVGLFHGDPDRNGTPEVYGANATALLRFTFAGGTWRQERIMDVRAGIQSLAVGDGDRDGKQEVWFGTPGGSAVRLRWTDSGLVKDVHALGSGPVRALLVGDADADGKPEVYAALGKTVWKLARESTGWEKTAIVDTNDAVSAMSFGYGDRTPVRKLWLGTTHGDLWRVRHHEGAWTLRHVGNGTPGQALHAVDNLEFFDGYPRPVVLSDDGRAYAFARANTTAPFERRTLATFPHDPVALSNFEVVTEGGFLYRMDQHGRALEIGRGRRR